MKQSPGEQHMMRLRQAADDAKENNINPPYVVEVTQKVVRELRQAHMSQRTFLEPKPVEPIAALAPGQVLVAVLFGEVQVVTSEGRGEG